VSKQEYAKLIRLRWEERVLESELLRMNDLYQPEEGEQDHTVGTVVQLDLLHVRLQRAKLEVELYSR
jgi:hypothetical protein